MLGSSFWFALPMGLIVASLGSPEVRLEVEVIAVLL
jgi:hypothetical protein